MTIRIVKHPFSRRRITHVVTGEVASIAVDNESRSVNLVVDGKTHRFHLTIDAADVDLMAMMAGHVKERRSSTP